MGLISFKNLKETTTPKNINLCLVKTCLFKRSPLSCYSLYIKIVFIGLRVRIDLRGGFSAGKIGFS